MSSKYKRIPSSLRNQQTHEGHFGDVCTQLGNTATNPGGRTGCEDTQGRMDAHLCGLPTGCSHCRRTFFPPDVLLLLLGLLQHCFGPSITLYSPVVENQRKLKYKR